jgi:lysozyme family protein
MTYDEAFEALIGHEGGFTLNPADNGNWTGGARGKGVLKGTKYGIAANTYPDVDIKALTLDQAKMIYRRDFWAKIGADHYGPKTAFVVFSIAVNGGLGRAAKCLQSACGVVPDGVIGPMTLSAARSFEDARLAARIIGQMLDFINDLSSWPTFGRGWTQRWADILKGL